MAETRRRGTTGARQHGLRADIRALWYASPLYRFWLKGPHPLRLTASPDDPWPGNAARGASILAGHFDYAGHVTPAKHAEFWALADSAPQAHREWLHSFRWLRDLARVADQDRARAVSERLMKDWLARHDRYDAFAWRPDVLGARLVHWSSHAPLVLSSRDLVYRSLVLNRMGEQSRHLARAALTGPDGLGRVNALLGLCFSGLLLPGLEVNLKRGLEALQSELDRLVHGDGGVASRSVHDALLMAQDLVSLREALRSCQQPVPVFVQTTLDRLVPFIRALRHADGGLAQFQGAFADMREVIDITLEATDAKGRAINSMPHSGFERLKRNRTLVIFDAGPPPAPGFGLEGHAGTLAFELSDGAERIVVNLGGTAQGWGGHQAELGQLARATAAHSTLVIDDTNSTELNPGRDLGPGAGLVDCQAGKTEDGLQVIARHDGYRRRFGVDHERRLLLNFEGTELIGEDRLITTVSGLKALGRRRGKLAQIRFHLMPGITAVETQTGDAVLLRLNNGRGWMFRASAGELTLEDSLYVDRPERARQSAQIVLSVPIDGEETRVHWSFSREG